MTRKKTPKRRSSKSSKRRSAEKFGEKQFVRSVWKVMKGQARKSPAVALLHERLEGKIKLIGLTGGIASGKSTVAGLFKAAKIPVIDADEIARQVVQPKKKVCRQIAASFGEGILLPDGNLDRERLGKIVFSDPSKRELLESITHPEISKEIAKRVAGFKKKKEGLVVIDVPLLFESGLSRRMHKNILVRVDPEIQAKRLMKRDRFSETQAWQRILAQMPTPEKEKLADFVVDNSGTPEETRKQIEVILKQLQRRQGIRV